MPTVMPTVAVTIDRVTYYRLSRLAAIVGTTLQQAIRESLNEFMDDTGDALLTSARDRDRVREAAALARKEGRNVAAAKTAALSASRNSPDIDSRADALAHLKAYARLPGLYGAQTRAGEVSQGEVSQGDRKIPASHTGRIDRHIPYRSTLHRLPQVAPARTRTVRHESQIGGASVNPFLSTVPCTAPGAAPDTRYADCRQQARAELGPDPVSARHESMLLLKYGVGDIRLTHSDRDLIRKDEQNRAPQAPQNHQNHQNHHRIAA